MNYLNHLARMGNGFIHPGGLHFSMFVKSKIIEQGKNTDVLEIGCGTGGTLVNLALSGQKKLTGVDVNSHMLREAKKRIKWNKCEGAIKVLQIENTGKLPFEDNSFDFIYAESVLAIVNETILPVLLAEIQRCLKPNGQFISNDAIWKDGTDINTITKTNTNCIRDFGIVQCIAQPAFKSDWLVLFEKYFRVENVFNAENLNKMEYPLGDKTKDVYPRRKKIGSLLNPGLIIRSLKFRLLLFKHREDCLHIITLLFVLRNNK